MRNKTKTTRTVLVAMLVVGSVLVFPLGAAMPVAAQENTTTVQNTTTETTDQACENPSVPEMDQVRLYAPETQITADEPGQIAGGFKLDNNQECPVVVAVTLTVPSGMTISGGSDWQSAGAGMVTTQFTLNEGSHIKDLTANVYSQEAGERRVTGNVEYWVEGHADSTAREIDSFSFTFDVQEPNTAPEVNEDSSTGDASTTESPSGDGDGWPLSLQNTVILGLFGVAALGIVGIMYVSPKVGIGAKLK